MKRIYKPNFVSVRKQTVIIHLGGSLPNCSSDLPENAVRIASNNERAVHIDVFLFGLAPRRVYPAALVTKHADALLPRRFTHHLLQAGLFSVALVVIRFRKKPDARTLSGSLPLWCSDFPLKFFNQSDYPIRFIWQGSPILAKNVQQTQF